MKFFLKIVTSTPLYKTIIMMQLLSSILTFVGIPLLIPIIESAQDNMASIELPNETLNWFISSLGIDKSFKIILLFVFLVFIFAEGVRMLSNLLAQKSRLRLVVKRRKTILKNYLHTDWRFLNKDKSGEMSDSIIRQADLSGFVHLNAIRLISWVIQFITYLSLALFISVDVTLLALIVYFCISVLNFINSIGYKKASDEFHQLSLRLATLVSDFQANRKQYKTTSVFSIFDPIDITVKDAANRFFHISLREELQGYWIHILGFGFLVSLLAFYESFNLGFSELIVLVLVFQRLSPAYQGTQKGYLDYRRDIPAYNLMANRIDAITKNREDNGDQIIKPNCDIEFQDVSFWYAHPDIVLEDISFVIEPNETIMIIGESGSGKSTILDLISGLLRPSYGEILYDGCETHLVNFEEFRKNIAYVGQDVTIKDGTIYENVVLGSNKEINPDLIENVRSVLSKVRLEAYSHEKDDGIHYEVGEGGSNLSGGQVQRLLLARALFREPSVLILDEATSSLDTKTDKQINEVLKNIKGESTIIIVTHKLNNLNLANKIAFLKDGRLLEFGTLDELLSNNGDFSKFYAIHESQKK